VVGVNAATLCVPTGVIAAPGHESAGTPKPSEKRAGGGCIDLADVMDGDATVAGVPAATF